jgi:hypothetical protein
MFPSIPTTAPKLHELFSLTMARGVAISAIGVPFYFEFEGFEEAC